MNRSVVLVTHYHGNILVAHELDGKVVDMGIYPEDGCHIKSVYIGKVKNIVKNIGAAFVEVAPGQMCFLSLDECADLLVLNRKRETSDLRQGDEILVQIIKGPVKKKAAVCTGRLRLPKHIKQEIFKIAPTRTVYSVLYSGRPAYLEVLDRIRVENVDRIVCANEELYESVDSYIACDDYKLSGDNISVNKDEIRSRINIYNDDYPIEKLYKLDSLFAELTSRKVWLDSGANIVIDYTEAMTVIDVNSAKSINLKGDTILKVNMEACDEAVRQIRLRNLSGMILIDFINDSQENTDRLGEYITSLVKDDYVRCEFVDFTALGIAEITRAKKNQPISEIF